MADAIDFETHEEMKRQLAQAEADGQRMTVEVARLRAALKPFADALTWAESKASQPYDPADLLLECRWFVTLYEFGKARAALTTPEALAELDG